MTSLILYFDKKADYRDFNNYLKTNSIRTLILCGFLAEYCVKQTAIDGLQNGYNISLLKEYIGTGNDVQHRKQEMLLDLENRGVTIIENIFD